MTDAADNRAGRNRSAEQGPGGQAAGSRCASNQDPAGGTPSERSGGGGGGGNTTTGGGGARPGPAAVDVLLAKGRVGRYKLIQLIGHGAMGSVLLGEDRTLNRRVALKVLPHESDTPEQQMFFEQFIREARSAAALMHHAIVQIFSVGISSGHAYIAMELLDGPDLACYVRDHGPMPVHLAASIAAEAAEGLAYAHDHGILHRDIKPANLVITKRNHCKICDFGVAQMLGSEEDFELIFNVVGTPMYLSPEAARGQSSPASDLWALAGVLWFMLTGSPPFPIRDAADARRVHTQLPLPDMRQLRPDVPEGLVRVLERALALEPRDRYANGDELLAALKPFTVPPANRSPPGTTPGTTPGTPPAPGTVLRKSPAPSREKSTTPHSKPRPQPDADALAAAARQATRPRHAQSRRPRPSQSNARRTRTMMIVVAVGLLALGLVAAVILLQAKA